MLLISQRNSPWFFPPRPWVSSTVIFCPTRLQVVPFALQCFWAMPVTFLAWWVLISVKQRWKPVSILQGAPRQVRADLRFVTEVFFAPSRTGRVCDKCNWNKAFLPFLSCLFLIQLSLACKPLPVPKCWQSWSEVSACVLIFLLGYRILELPSPPFGLEKVF